MQVDSNDLVDYLVPRLGASEGAVRQQLSKAGKAGAFIRSKVMGNHSLINVYDLDLIIEYFEHKIEEKSLNRRLPHKVVALWQEYLQILEEFKYDLYRCT